jgi:hypothetical protein
MVIKKLYASNGGRGATGTSYIRRCPFLVPLQALSSIHFETFVQGTHVFPRPQASIFSHNGKLAHPHARWHQHRSSVDPLSRFRDRHPVRERRNPPQGSSSRKWGKQHLHPWSGCFAADSFPACGRPRSFSHSKPCYEWVVPLSPVLPPHFTRSAQFRSQMKKPAAQRPREECT